MRAHVLLAFAASLSLVASTSLADVSAACKSAYENGQTSRLDGKLRAAHGALTTCSESCPAALARDCRAWLKDVEKDLGSAVLEAKDESGKDVYVAHASIDGEPVAVGAEVMLEAGEHTVRLEPDGRAPVESKLSVAKGERKRVARIVVPTPTAPTAPAAPAPPERPASPLPAVTPATLLPLPGGAPPRPEPRVIEHDRPVTIETLVFGGVGLLSLGGFAAFGATSLTKRNDLDATKCKPSCSPDAIRSIQNGFLAADTLLGVGITSLAIATTLYVVRPDVPKRVGLVVTAEGVGARF